MAAGPLPFTSAYRVSYRGIRKADEHLPDSYDAGEDNEISFKEGDRITHIEAVSDDWWQGTDPHGNVGLFPGAYLVLWTLSRHTAS